MTTAVIWSKDNCPYCDHAKALLTSKGIVYEEKKVGDGPSYNYTREDLLKAVPTARTFPQIFLGEEHVGGFTDLQAKLKESN